MLLYFLKAQASEKQNCTCDGSLVSLELLSSLADVTIITITKSV